MTRIEEIKQKLATFTRPALVLGGFKAIHASLERAREWDAANPTESFARGLLLEELTREEKRTEREEAEKLSLDRRLRAMGQKLARSGVGGRSLAAAAKPEDTEALSIVKRWLPEKDLTWLVLCGPKGTGKSVAATWAVREAFRGGSTGAFRSSAALAKLSQFDAGAEELAHLKSVHLLVLDDFGTELLNDYARAQFHELLDHRHESYGRTIITSNLAWHASSRKDAGGVTTVPGLHDRLGERLVDRIDQAGRKVQLGAKPSMRRKSSEAA